MYFTKLDDSPMFRKQIESLEESAESLKERCLKFYKGCRKYTEGLGEGYDEDIAFASSLEMFGGGHNDPISVAFGGPVMTKFTIALREIGTYKEVLRSQVESMLNDRLLQFVDVDLHDVKDARKRFDKASLVYDQAREKYLALKKSTRADIATVLEDELHSARSSFEQARFTLVTALSNIEAKKRYEFLEAVSGTMEAHLRYFKQGYELLHQMEPYIHQVLAYAQQSRERSNYEQAALVERVQEFKRQIDRESRWSPNGSHDSPNGDGIQAIGRSSHKMIEAVMQSAAKGKVQTIRQGYLSKRSSNLRGDWKRRFFVLDSRGMLYYYRKQLSRSSGSHHSHQRYHNSSEHGSGLLSRWFSSHYHGGVHDEKSVARHTVNLLTSTIKVDADQSDLRFCFRIISPAKNYTLQIKVDNLGSNELLLFLNSMRRLFETSPCMRAVFEHELRNACVFGQAESAMDQMDWIEKITGVIASLLSSHSPEQQFTSPSSGGHYREVSENSSLCSSADLDQLANDDSSMEKGTSGGHFDRSIRNAQQYRFNSKHEKPIDLLQTVRGNDICADCGAVEPDWASLNLGVLLCIECSGVHRNLGVHISKVRSLTLDVRVWEPSVINLFQSMGNTFANSIWEETLASTNSRNLGDISSFSMIDKNQAQSYISKPKHSDPITVKEKFIQMKYAEKLFVNKTAVDQLSVAQQMWESVRTNDKKAVYHHIVSSDADVNIIYGQASINSCLTLAKAMLLQDQPTAVLDHSSSCLDNSLQMSSISLDRDEVDDFFEGFSLLHLACLASDIGMVELLLQYGANVNSTDLRGRTPLHHCILRGRYQFAKLLLSRGANPNGTDENGKTVIQYAIEAGNTDDDEIIALLEDPNR